MELTSSYNLDSATISSKLKRYGKLKPADEKNKNHQDSVLMRNQCHQLPILSTWNGTNVTRSPSPYPNTATLASITATWRELVTFWMTLVTFSVITTPRPGWHWFVLPKLSRINCSTPPARICISLLQFEVTLAVVASTSWRGTQIGFRENKKLHCREMCLSNLGKFKLLRS